MRKLILVFQCRLILFKQQPLAFCQVVVDLNISLSNASPLLHYLIWMCYS